MSEENKARLVSDEQLEKWKSLPNKIKSRQLQGADAFCKVMEAFLKANTLPMPKKENKKRVKKTTTPEIKKFKRLLNNPSAVWKVIADGKGGAL